MSGTLTYPYLFFVFLITLLGGWLPTVQTWSKQTFHMVISFCAGILLGAVFFHVLPEIAPVLGTQLGGPVLVGFLLIFILEKFLMVHPCEEGECDYHKIGVAAYIGIGFHSLLDGLAIGAGSMLDLSMVIILAVMLHKFPAALALSSLLVKAGEFTPKKILVYMFVFALATPLGALGAYFFLQSMDAHFVAVALGVSAGSFLYIAVGDLLPTVHEEHDKRYRNLVCLCLGIASMALSQGLA